MQTPIHTIGLNMNTENRTMKNFAIATILGLAATMTGIVIKSAPAHAADLSFTDNLTNPNHTPFYSFIADGTSNVTIRSNSWETGGFDLNMTLFDSAGNWYDERDDIGVGNLDFEFSAILPAGTYQVAIAAFGNNSAGFGDLSTPFYGAGDFQGRTSEYAFEILNVSETSTSVPEPSSLIGTAIAGFTVVMFKRRSSSKKL
jgi:hypothetical protein